MTEGCLNAIFKQPDKIKIKKKKTEYIELFCVSVGLSGWRVCKPSHFRSTVGRAEWLSSETTTAPPPL